MKKLKYKVRGPVSNNGWDFWWVVIGPRGGVKSEWYTRSAAKKEAKRLEKSE
jgi:hypothetical protein